MRAQTTSLRVLAGGKPSHGRVLRPASALARRAGITPVAVPDDMWVAPSILATPMAALRTPRAERHLRAVA